MNPTVRITQLRAKLVAILNDFAEADSSPALIAVSERLYDVSTELHHIAASVDQGCPDCRDSKPTGYN
jgi:hypothetical protein